MATHHLHGTIDSLGEPSVQISTGFMRGQAISSGDNVLTQDGSTKIIVGANNIISRDCPVRFSPMVDGLGGFGTRFGFRVFF